MASKRKRDKVEVDDEKVGTAPIGKRSPQDSKPFPVQPENPILNGDRNDDNHDLVTISVGKTLFKVRLTFVVNEVRKPMDIDFSAPTDASDQTSHVTISRNFEVEERHSQSRVRRYLLYPGRKSRQLSGIMLDPKRSVSCNMSISNLPHIPSSFLVIFPNQPKRDHGPSRFVQGGFPPAHRRLTHGA